MKRTQTNSNLSLIVIFFSVVILSLIWWGLENSQVAVFLIENPIIIPHYLLEKLGFFNLAGGILVIIAIFVFLVLNFARNYNRHENKKVLRGSKLISDKELKAIFKQESQSQDKLLLEIGGIPIPERFENRGFFMFGSPGTGKSQAISQMTATIRKRSDFRAIIFDRNGEMVEKFYDPKRDLIFNPFDARSVGWSHTKENMRPETMAAGLIPHEAKNPYFSNAARAVLSELFRQTKNNEELWSLLESDAQTLKSFLSGTFAATYLAEERSATSVLTTILNSCQFYPYLHRTGSKSLSFYDWGNQDDSRWIFLTLKEDDTELLKPLHSLVFELMLKGLLSNEYREIKTAIIIDELGALNQLPSLHRLLSESRKYKGCPILGTQTQSQITKIYGKEDTSIILQGTKTKLILGCVDPETAKAMADIIGKHEYIYIAESYSRSRHSGRSGSGKTESFNEQFRDSYAVLPEDIMGLPDLVGYLKIAQYCVLVKLTHNKFPRHHQRFIPLSDLKSDSKDFQDRWDDLDFD